MNIHKNIVCFYHGADFDGICSAAIVNYFHRLRNEGVHLIPVNYGDSIIDYNLEGVDVVYVVDFSFGIYEMEELLTTKFLRWFDHHKSAVENVEQAGLQLTDNCRLIIGKAGCEITWEALFPEVSMPEGVRLLGRYDVWDHVEHALNFQYGIRHPYFDASVDNYAFWETLFQGNINLVNKIIDVGKYIHQYESSQNKKFAKSYCDYIKFLGYNAVIMNKGFANSLSFESVYNPEIHDIMIKYVVKKSGIFCSIYSTKLDIDVSIIARYFGGGGHKGASGFSVETLDQLYNNEEPII